MVEEAFGNMDSRVESHGGISTVVVGATSRAIAVHARISINNNIGTTIVVG